MMVKKEKTVGKRSNARDISAPESSLGAVYMGKVAGIGNQYMLGALEEAKPNEGEAKSLNLESVMLNKLQTVMGYNLQGVKLEESNEPEKMGKDAIAQGGTISFAPGAFRPDMADGRRLIGHEMAHVVQQATGRTHTAGGLLESPYLESSADRAGEASVAAPFTADPGEFAPLPAMPATVPAQGGIFGKKKTKSSAPPKTTAKSSATSASASKSSPTSTPLLYSSLGEEISARYANVRYTDSLGEFIMHGGNRDSQEGDPNPKKLMQKAQIDRFAELSSQEVTPLTNMDAGVQSQLAGALKAGGDIDPSLLGAAGGQVFGNMLDLMGRYLTDPQGSALIMEQASAHRGATAGREGDQDVFGNDENLLRLLMNNMSLYGATPVAVGEANRSGEQKEAKTKASSAGSSMANVFFNNPIEGEPDDPEVINQYAGSLSQKRNGQGITPDLVRKFLAVKGSLRGIISPQQAGTSGTAASDAGTASDLASTSATATTSTLTDIAPPPLTGTDQLPATTSPPPATDSPPPTTAAPPPQSWVRKTRSDQSVPSPQLPLLGLSPKNKRQAVRLKRPII